jgi:polyisoprenoid-binding protein YceI
MPASTTARRWPRRVLVAVVVVAVLAVAVPFTYIHFVEGKAPAKLTLTPSGTDAASGATTGSAATPGAVDGTWTVGSGSIVGYRVSETLVGQHNTAVGRTSSVTGSLTLTGTTVATATFTAQMATVTSDESQRDNQFDGRIMNVARYPTATFTLRSPINLGSIPPAGVIRSYQADGALAMHGQTHVVSFTLNAERTSDLLEVQGEIPIAFATRGIANPSFGSFVTTADNGTLEFLLHLRQGAPSSSTTTTTTTPSGGGFGGPVTVPATTTPPLSLGG